MENIPEKFDNNDVYSNGTDLLVNAGFYNALIDVSVCINVNEYESRCRSIVKVGKDIARFVNHIAIRKEKIILTLDPLFDMSLIPQFRSDKGWIYNIDVLNLTKGYSKNTSEYPTMHIVKPVIWSREAKA